MKDGTKASVKEISTCLPSVVAARSTAVRYRATVSGTAWPSTHIIAGRSQPL